MDLTRFHRRIVHPGLYELEGLGGPPMTHAAERFLVAVALQESDAIHRYQNSPSDTPGPARGWWQFEAIAVQEMLTNRVTSVLAKKSCDLYDVQPFRNAVHRAIEGHDGLAVAFARLLVLTHVAPLPDSLLTGWQQYLDLWRPGKPRQERWESCWRRATEVTLPAGGDDADTQAGTV